MAKVQVSESRGYGKGVVTFHGKRKSQRRRRCWHPEKPEPPGVLKVERRRARRSNASGLRRMWRGAVSHWRAVGIVDVRQYPRPLVSVHGGELQEGRQLRL